RPAADPFSGWGSGLGRVVGPRTLAGGGWASAVGRVTRSRAGIRAWAGLLARERVGALRRGSRRGWRGAGRSTRVGGGARRGGDACAGWGAGLGWVVGPGTLAGGGWASAVGRVTRSRAGIRAWAGLLARERVGALRRGSRRGCRGAGRSPRPGG